MARRHDIERIFQELEEIRGVLNDPTTGLGAFHQDQDQLRRKVLENVQQGTAGLREENRELRRRQERMLSDLGDTRTAVEALRREIAQAWAHTLGVPRPAAGDSRTPIALPEQRPQPLEAGTNSNETDGWREQAVPEVTLTDPADDGNDGRDAQPSTDATAAAPAESAPLASTAPEASATAMPEEPPAVPDPTPTDAERRAARRAEQRSKHLQGLLTAAAISSARLICHKHTWAFLLEQTSRHPHFRLPDHITDIEDGRIETHLSGRSLLAVLVTTREILDDDAPDLDMATWALADAIYRRTQLAVADATLTRPEGSEVTTIVLDDRPDRPGQADAA
ncbi:hypothetical protein [Streptomyces cupreus]|uniref:Uncharacterized protein n=1 Tax=Streptomyces cupreus TaxID=2759956 RepID=A0A7X1JBR8_9ACTN|nr:hypothetical protein [Streptomyces cupreus]MBC2907856.1 hypothetical protein [Streptomyces cupreus]